MLNQEWEDLSRTGWRRTTTIKRFPWWVENLPIRWKRSEAEWEGKNVLAFRHDYRLQMWGIYKEFEIRLRITRSSSSYYSLVIFKNNKEVMKLHGFNSEEIKAGFYYWRDTGEKLITPEEIHRRENKKRTKKG
jgi:hypothetical protein